MAIVTGASGRIGRAVAGRLATDGTSVLGRCAGGRDRAGRIRSVNGGVA